METVESPQYDKDSLKVTENEDGSFAIEWDPEDPVWYILNDMNEEQISEFFSNAVAQYIKDLDLDIGDLEITPEETDNVSIHDD